MATFEQTLDRTQKILEKWSEYEKLQTITVIRDVLGRIALFLETEDEISDSSIDDLKQKFQGDLKAYFQGNIYKSGGKQSDLLKALIKEIERLRSPWKETDGKKWFLLERAIAKKAWVDCRFQEEAIWPYEKAKDGETPKVVTFYSFKGGMGRTTALAAAAMVLAQKGKNVLMIDTDIEAPGLATLFLDEDDVREGTVDYLLEAALIPRKEKIPMDTMLHQVTDPVLTDGLRGKLFVLPAGKINDGYLQKLARIDYQDSIPDNMKMQLSRLIEEAIKNIKKICSIDYVFLDARAGFHDMGGVVTAQMPHGVVLFGKDSRQSWQGIELVLRTISTSQKTQPFVAIVDSACGNSGIITKEEEDNFTNQAYTACCEFYYNEDDLLPALNAQGEVHSPIFVPYQSILAEDIQLYSDGSIQKNERVSQLKRVLLGENYQKIGNRIQSWFGEEESFIYE